MSRGAPPRKPALEPSADYVSVRFRSAVTFSGITLQEVAVGQPYTLTHTPAALVVRWKGDAARGLAPQVRIVPWCNVACAEPRPSVAADYAKVDKR